MLLFLSFFPLLLFFLILFLILLNPLLLLLRLILINHYFLIFLWQLWLLNDTILFLLLLAIPLNGQLDDVKRFLDHDKLIMLVTNQHNNVSTSTSTSKARTITRLWKLDFWRNFNSLTHGLLLYMMKTTSFTFLSLHYPIIDIITWIWYFACYLHIHR